MALALEGLDLLTIVLFAFLLAFLYALKWTITPMLNALHSALGWVPGVGGLVSAAESAIIGGINGAITGVETATVDLWNGVVWSWNEFLSGSEAIGHALWKSLDHAYNIAIPTALASLEGWLHSKILDVGSRVTALENTIVDDIANAEQYTRDRVAEALSTAERYTDDATSRAISTAEAFTHDAVAALRAAEDAAISNVQSIASQAEQDAQQAAAAAATDLTKAEAYASSYADSIGKQAWQGIDDLTATVGKDFDVLTNNLGLAGAAGLIASIPLIATLVNTIAAESGLDNQACRQKVKGICATDPLAWENLLLGIVAIGAAFDLADVVRAAVTMLGTAESLISKVASVSQGEIEEVGQIVGQAALAIAA